MLDNVISSINDYYKQKIKEMEENYEAKAILAKREYEINYEELKRKHSDELKESTRIRTYKGKYYNLKDFVKVSNQILFIKETELKQWLESIGILEKDGDKYIPSGLSVYCILHENELYLDYEFIRTKIVFLRSMIYMDSVSELEDEMFGFIKSKSIITEQMANTVYIECKQRSNEFKKHREDTNEIIGRVE